MFDFLEDIEYFQTKNTKQHFIDYFFIKDDGERTLYAKITIPQKTKDHINWSYILKVNGELVFISEIQMDSWFKEALRRSKSRLYNRDRLKKLF